MAACIKLSFIQGLPFPPSFNQERIDSLKDVRLSPGDVFVATYPKSGTTWSQQMVKLIRSNGVDDGERLSASVPWIERHNREFVDGLPQPRSFKTHTSYSLMAGMEPVKSPAKYIYVARNPKDVAVSMYHHVTSLIIFEFQGSWDVFFNLFIEGKVESGLWFDHVLEWWKHKDAPNVLFLKYDDMKKDPHQAVQSIASFIGCNLEPQVVESIVEQSSFQHMKSTFKWDPRVEPRHANASDFFRKGVVGDWKNYFTEEQDRRFDELYAQRMRGTGLEFAFQ